MMTPARRSRIRALLLKIVLDAYARGIISSWRIERNCREKRQITSRERYRYERCFFEKTISTTSTRVVSAPG